MNETAARLRAQKAYSTDPDYLERMALAEEARDARIAGKETGCPPIFNGSYRASSNGQSRQD